MSEHIMDIPFQRLYNQHLISPRVSTPLEVTDHFGAIQGQDYAGSKWALALRIPGCTEAMVSEAIRNRQVVRTWLMRGTLAFASAGNLHWMLALLGPDLVKARGSRRTELGLTTEILQRCRSAFAEALRGGRILTRDEAYSVINACGASSEGQRGYHILSHLALEGLLCFGPPSGNKDTFVLLDEWVPKSDPLTRPQALSRLAMLYFSSHGPATLQDFAWWSGLKMTDARLGLLGIEDTLESVESGGRIYRMPKNPAIPIPEEQALLLPGFDEYLLGYKDRSDVLDPTRSRDICPGNNGMFFPTIILQGRVAGTWKREIKRNQVKIALNPFSGLSGEDRTLIETAAGRYGEYLGGYLAIL